MTNIPPTRFSLEARNSPALGCTAKFAAFPPLHQSNTPFDPSAAIAPCSPALGVRWERIAEGNTRLSAAPKLPSPQIGKFTTVPARRRATRRPMVRFGLGRDGFDWTGQGGLAWRAN